MYWSSLHSNFPDSRHSKKIVSRIAEFRFGMMCYTFMYVLLWWSKSRWGKQGLVEDSFFSFFLALYIGTVQEYEQQQFCKTANLPITKCLYVSDNAWPSVIRPCMLLPLICRHSFFQLWGRAALEDKSLNKHALFCVADGFHCIDYCTVLTFSFFYPLHHLMSGCSWFGLFSGSYALHHNWLLKTTMKWVKLLKPKGRKVVHPTFVCLTKGFHHLHKKLSPGLIWHSALDDCNFRPLGVFIRWPKRHLAIQT